MHIKSIYYLQSTVLVSQSLTRLTNTLFTSTESTEVFSSLGDSISKELFLQRKKLIYFISKQQKTRYYLESHTTRRLTIDGDIEKDFGKILGSHFVLFLFRLRKNSKKLNGPRQNPFCMQNQAERQKLSAVTLKKS
jgi:hypothetical protein